MYNPSQGSNFYNEWIEIFNDGSDMNLENFSLCGITLLPGYVDREGNIHNENGMVLEANSYALITDSGTGTEVYDNFNVDENALALHVDASSLCGGLTNSGETITLESNGNIIDEVTYEDSAEQGYSLKLINGNFIESSLLGGTPGSENAGGNNEDNGSGNQNSDEQTDSNNSNLNNIGIDNNQEFNAVSNTL